MLCTTLNIVNNFVEPVFNSKIESSRWSGKSLLRTLLVHYWDVSLWSYCYYIIHRLVIYVIYWAFEDLSRHSVHKNPNSYFFRQKCNSSLATPMLFIKTDLISAIHKHIAKRISMRPIKAANSWVKQTESARSGSSSGSALTTSFPFLVSSRAPFSPFSMEITHKSRREKKGGKSLRRWVKSLPVLGLEQTRHWWRLQEMRPIKVSRLPNGAAWIFVPDCFPSNVMRELEPGLRDLRRA